MLDAVLAKPCRSEISWHSCVQAVELVSIACTALSPCFKRSPGGRGEDDGRRLEEMGLESRVHCNVILGEFKLA